jgi:hypothetical protein
VIGGRGRAGADADADAMIFPEASVLYALSLAGVHGLHPEDISGDRGKSGDRTLRHRLDHRLYSTGLLGGAVASNASWCDAVCQAYGYPGTFSLQLWTNTGHTACGSTRTRSPCARGRP